MDPIKVLDLTLDAEGKVRYVKTMRGYRYTDVDVSKPIKRVYDIVRMINKLLWGV